MSKNPFLKTQINSAFDKSPDSEKIHQQLTNRILNTISQIKEQGSILQVLIGAPGSGKTHLLSRLWRISSQEENKLKNGFLFVSVPPPGDITRISLHILRELVASLLEKYSEDKNELLPLDLFITEILRKILIKTLPEDQSSIKEKISVSKSDALFHLLTKSDNKAVFINHSINNFAQVFPNIEVQLSQALFALLDPFRKSYVLKWFQGGELTDSERDTLNIGTKYINEDLALVLCKSLINLSPFPILLTVDQLESTFYRFKNDGLIKLVDNTIALLQEKKNLFLLLVVQTQEWLDNIRNNLPRYLIDRVSKIHPIKPLTLNEGYDLIKLRLETFHMTADTIFLQQKLFYPFSRDFVSEVYKLAGGNPRQLLNQLRDCFDFAEQTQFNPNWEQEYVDEKGVDEEIIYSKSEIIDFYDNLFLEESNNQANELQSISFEKLSELVKAFLITTISESYSILYFKYLSERTLKINSIEDEILYDIVLDNIHFKFNRIGIIIANQKNLTQFQSILDKIILKGSFPKTIILRSNKLENLDITPGIKLALSKINELEIIEFMYLDNNLEINILVSNYFINNAKDIVISSKFPISSDFMISYLLNKFLDDIPIFTFIYDKLNTHKVKSRTESRIRRLILSNQDIFERKIAYWQNMINLREFKIVQVSFDEGIEFGLLFSYQFDEQIHWGLFRGSGVLKLSTFIEKLIIQLDLDCDPLGIFAFSGSKNITHLINKPISYIISEYGYGVHLSIRDELEETHEYRVLSLIKYLESIYHHIPSNENMTPESLKKVIGDNNLPTVLLGTFAQLLGPFLNVSFINGKIYSTSKLKFDYSSVMETVKERNIIEGIESAKKSEYKDALDLAEERGEIQKIWDDSIIELTNRVMRFNLFIDPADYEILTAILNYAKISPDTLTPLIRGLVSEFGRQKNTSVNLSLEQILRHILANYQPFKEEWMLLRTMPPLISSLGTNLQLMGYMLNAFTLLDFHSIELDQNWHDLISQSTKAFIKSNLTIQQLSETYYSQKFESNTKTTLLPIVNKYQSLIIDETKLIEEKYANIDSEDRINDYLTLARHISEWWLILESFNRIVGYEFHLDNMPFMDEILERYQVQFTSRPINFVSTNPLTFTLFFENALELMAVDSDKLSNIHLIRSELSSIQAQLYQTLLEKKFNNKPEEYCDGLSFWRMFYHIQSLDPSISVNLVLDLEKNLNLFPKELLKEKSNIFNILLQLITPNIVFNQTNENNIEKNIFTYLMTWLFRKGQNKFELKEQFHKLEMLLILPIMERSSNANYELKIDNIKKIFPLQFPLFKQFDKKVKINQNYFITIGTNLDFDRINTLVLNNVQQSGLKLTGQKNSKNFSIYIFKGERRKDQNLELEVGVQYGNKGTSIKYEFKWDKFHNIENDVIFSLVAVVIGSILLEKQTKKLNDKAFVVYCAVCGYQINLIKNKDFHILFPCNKCGVQNVVHPNVYKLIKDFIK